MLKRKRNLSYFRHTHEQIKRRVATHMSEGAGSDDEHVDHVDGYDKDGGECHHPPHHLPPHRVLVPQVLYRGICSHAEDKHTLQNKENDV